MIEVKNGVKILDLESIDLPYTIQLYGVSEEMFDELTDEDTKAELIDGVMIMHSPASLWHENLGSFLGGLMGFFADAKELGTVIASGNGIVHLATGRKVAPDAFFIRQQRVPTPLPKEFEGAPDLVVEVVSPSNRSYDLDDKRRAYQEAGVGEIWFLDKKYKQVIVDHQQDEGYVEEIVTEGKIHSTALEGFWIDASWLWAEPLPSRMTCLQEILGEGQTQ